jgi:ribonuclease-3
VTDLQLLQQEIGFLFRKEDYLRLALTHPSVVHEPGNVLQHNQRLEFLGDSVLQLILTHELYERYPSAGEGPLTKARAKLVNRAFLAEQGRRLKLGEHLVLSRGEEMHGGRQRASALADAFEAVVGAIYLDGGFGAAIEFVRRSFRVELEGFTALPNLENPKGELQELLQARSTEAPQYHVEKISGPDHERLFECAVYHQGVELGRGSGGNKKTAESRAALMALARIRQRESLEPDAGDLPMPGSASPGEKTSP